jgi:uncharacterized protein (TIGR03000 family)
MLGKRLSLALVCGLACIVLPGSSSEVWAQPVGVLHHYGYYNPNAYQSRYLYYPFVGGGAYPWYDYRPYYGWSIVPAPLPGQGAAQGRLDATRRDTPGLPRNERPAKAHITLEVPADAEVRFNGHKTRSTGAVREYDSPPLSPGYDYTYQVQATWQQGGRTVSQSREVSVTRGSRVTLTFPQRGTSPAAAKAVKTP